MTSIKVLVKKNPFMYVYPTSHIMTMSNEMHARIYILLRAGRVGLSKQGTIGKIQHVFLKVKLVFVFYSNQKKNIYSTKYLHLRVSNIDATKKLL